jgi:hypothetical protein
MFMKKMLIVICIIAASCSSTVKIVQSWKAPDSSYTPVQFQKVLIIVLGKDEAFRSNAEDKIASGSSTFHASHLLFPNKQIIGEEGRFKNVIKENGFDGVVTLRLLGKDKENTWVAGNYTAGFWAFRNNVYPAYYQPGYFDENTSYTIETTVFSMNQDKLLWSGITAGTNPSSLKRTIDEVLKEVIRQMKKDNFLPGK